MSARFFRKIVFSCFVVPPIGTAPRRSFFFFETSEQSFGGAASFVDAPLGTAPSNLMYTFFLPCGPLRLLQAGRSGVHSRVVPPTRHTLGPRDAVRRYLGLVSPVCCGCAVRVEPRSGPLGQDGIDFFFLLSHLTVPFIGPCVYLKVHQRAVPP